MKNNFKKTYLLDSELSLVVTLPSNAISDSSQKCFFLQKTNSVPKKIKTNTTLLDTAKA